MLRGQFSSISMGTVIFVGTVLAILFFMGNNIVSIRSEIAGDKKTLDVVDLANLAADCLKKEGIIDSETLNAKRGGPFSNAIAEGPDICRGREFFVSVRDLEGPGTWKFGTEGKTKNINPVFVPIRIGNEIHIGELYASI